MHPKYPYVPARTIKSNTRNILFWLLYYTLVYFQYELIKKIAIAVWFSEEDTCNNNALFK